MKVLVIDHILFHGTLLAQRLAHDGHEVILSGTWGPKSDSAQMLALGRGFPGIKLDQDGWMNWVGKVDVATITGSEHQGKVVKYLRDHGTPVSGPGKWQAKLELDRGFGRDVFAEMGFNPANTTVFTDLDKLIAFIEEHPKRYVLKLDQFARAESETVIGEDPTGGDIIATAEQLAIKLKYAKGLVHFYLEEMLEGVEVGIGGWFNGQSLLGPLMVTYEGMGAYGYDLSLDPSGWIPDQGKMLQVMKKYDYHGPFDINGFLTPEGEYRPIEWTPRWASGTTEMFCHSAPDLGELLYACATGGKAKTLKSDVVGKTTAIVNIRDDSSELTDPHPIVLTGSQKDLPIITSDVSMWVLWPSKTKTGWVSLPIYGANERRLGAYVGVGEDFNDAIDKVDAFTDKYRVSGADVTIGRGREELNKKQKKVTDALKMEEYRESARDFRHLYTSPLR